MLRRSWKLRMTMVNPPFFPLLTVPIPTTFPNEGPACNLPLEAQSITGKRKASPTKPWQKSSSDAASAAEMAMVLGDVDVVQLGQWSVWFVQNCAWLRAVSIQAMLLIVAVC